MKFALINVYFRYNSTGKNLEKNKKRLENLGHEVKIFYGARKQDTDDPNVIFYGNRLSRFVHMLGSKYLGLDGVLSNFSTSKLIRYLKEYQPDVVWLSGLHGYHLNWYRLIQFLKKNNIWTVYGMVDEFPFLGKCASSFDCENYKTGCGNCPLLHHYPESVIFDNSRFIFNRKKKAYKGWDKVIFRSAPYVVEKAKGSPLTANKRFSVSDSSVNAEIFSPKNSSALKSQLGIPEDKKVMLLCAPSNDPHKGAQYFLECARKCEKDGIVFVHVAFKGNKESLPSNYIPISFVKDPQLLAEYYSMADAYLCTSVSDAQPNACLEALSCGTPIIGFNMSGVPFIAPNEFGTFVEPLNTDALAKAVRCHPKKTEDFSRRCREYALGRFSLEATAEKHAKFIAQLCTLVENDKRSSDQ